MIHWAKIDDNNVVEMVVVGETSHNDQDGLKWCEENFGGRWIRTYPDGSLRKRFAGIGYSYDENNDVFIPPKPYASWVINSDFDWQPPTNIPEGESLFVWDEESLSWVEVNG